jgi:hypothetical protein
MKQQPVRGVSVGFVVALVAYIGFSAVRAIWLHASLDVKHTSDYLLFLHLPTFLLMSAGWPLVFWNRAHGGIADLGVNREDLRGAFRPLGTRAARRTALWLNASTFASCIPVCIAPALVYARTANAVGIAFVPFFATVLSGNLKRKWLPCSLLVLGCCLLSWQELQKPFIKSGYIALVGILVAVVGGFLAAVNIILSRKLNDAGATAPGVFIRRYWLLLIIAVAWSLLFHSVSDEGFSWRLSSPFWEVVLIGCVGMLIPSFSYQWVIAASNTIVSAFAVPMVPITVFIVELVRSGHLASFPYVAGFGVLLVSTGVFLGMRHPRPKPIQTIEDAITAPSLT